MLKKKLQKLKNTSNAKKRILSLVPQNSICAEIGVWKGDYSNLIFKKVKPKRFYLIDPWKYFPEYNRRWYGGSYARNQEDMDRIYKKVVQRFKKKKSVIIIKEVSEQASKKIKNNSLDFIYIDGNHSYQHVKRDLELYFPKVKPGGIIAGDDLIWGIREGLPVLRALTNFIIRNRTKIDILNLKGGQYIMKKIQIVYDI